MYNEHDSLTYKHEIIILDRLTLPLKSFNQSALYRSLHAMQSLWKYKEIIKRKK